MAIARERIIDIANRTIDNTRPPTIARFGGLSIAGAGLGSAGLGATDRGIWLGKKTWPSREEVGTTITELASRNVVSAGTETLTVDDALRWGVDAALYETGYKTGYDADKANTFVGTIRYPAVVAVSDAPFRKLVQRAIAAVRYTVGGQKLATRNAPHKLGWSVLKEKGWYPNEDKVGELIKQIIPGTQY